VILLQSPVSLALDIISQSNEQDFLILSDFLSCVYAVESRNLENPLAVEILERVHHQLHVDRRITFVRVPSHIDIARNTAVDAVAKPVLVYQYETPRSLTQTLDHSYRVT
jgi:hypothetical protein